MDFEDSCVHVCLRPLVSHDVSQLDSLSKPGCSGENILQAYSLLQPEKKKHSILTNCSTAAAAALMFWAPGLRTAFSCLIIAAVFLSHIASEPLPPGEPGLVSSEQWAERSGWLVAISLTPFFMVSVFSVMTGVIFMNMLFPDLLSPTAIQVTATPVNTMILAFTVSPIGSIDHAQRHDIGITAQWISSYCWKLHSVKGWNDQTWCEFSISCDADQVKQPKNPKHNMCMCIYIYPFSILITKY